MKELYEFAQISKQAHRTSILRVLGEEDKLLLLAAYLTTERSNHPAMSLKKLYLKCRPDFVGRDEFIAFGMQNGFESIHKVTFHKTTHSGKSNAAPNLLHDAVLTGINQVWVSDIFYFKIAGKNHYVVLIVDVYSREILGWHASANMFASANLIALQMALDFRGIAHFGGKLIHHSDKGVQFRSLEYSAKLAEYGIRISMGNCCFDNSHMESANGIIKNEYLIHRPINSLNDLTKYLKQDVELYNSERPHGSLKMMTPRQFECYISNIPVDQRTKLPIFTDKFRSNKMLLIMPDNQQLRLQFPAFR